MRNKLAFIVVCAISVISYTQSPALAGGCPNNCNGHGTCNPDLTCSCFPGFAGVDCGLCAPNYYNYPTCTFCLAATTCSGNGYCTVTGSCICNAPYFGPNCSQGAAVPTVSEWGLAGLTLTGIVAGAILFSRRIKTAKVYTKK